MEKAFITIAGQQYRVEVNWNATVAYLGATGRDTMDALAQMGTIRPSDLAHLMVACITEGERLEGRECDLTPELIGERCDYVKLTEFLKIFARQFNPQTAEDPKKD